VRHVSLEPKNDEFWMLPSLEESDTERPRRLTVFFQYVETMPSVLSNIVENLALAVVSGSASNHGRLTVKLRGRTTTLDERRGRKLFPGARGAQPQMHHGPLERLLDGTGSAAPHRSQF